MGVLDRLYQLMDENPNITNQEMAKVLKEEGIVASEESVLEFFKLVGLKDEGGIYHTPYFFFDLLDSLL